MPTSLYLIRHGAYVHEASPAGEAASDFGLSDLGRQQALSLHDRLITTREIQADAFFCSTLTRAVQTAEILAPALGIAPRALPELCEWESGNEALGLDVFMAQMQALPFPQRRQHRFYPGCETMAEFTARVQTKLAELLRMFDGKTLVLVVHGGVIEAAFSHCLGFGPGPFEGGYPAVGNASLTLWRQSDVRGVWTLEFSNDMHHLRGVA